MEVVSVLAVAAVGSTVGGFEESLSVSWPGATKEVMEIPSLDFVRHY